MDRLKPPTRRAPSPAVVVLAVSSAGLLSSCSRPQVPPKPAAAPPAPTPAQAQPTPVANPVLTRAQLIAAAAAARDAYARGAPYPGANADLVGRRFSVKLPFGCTAEPATTDPAALTLDPADKSLTVSAQPQVWTGAPWLGPIVGQDPPVEAVEGFWLRRPWTNSELCPATPVPPPAPSGGVAPPPAASPESLGLVRIYRSGDSRLKRHVRHPYRVVLKLSDARLPLDRRFWLVIEGRVAPLDGGDGKGQPIRCSAPSSDVRPVCLVGVELDHVAVQAQATGQSLADWAG